MRIPLHATAGLAILAAMAVLSLQSAPQVDAFDYLSNGGFEAGSGPWIAAPGAVLDTVGLDVVDAREGAHSGRIVLQADTSTFSIRQHVVAGNPGVLHFAAWVRTATRANDFYAQLANDNTSEAIRVSGAPQDDTWIALNADLTVGAGAELTLTIAGHGEPGDIVYVDGVQIAGSAPATPTDLAESPQPTLTRSPTSTGTPATTPTTTPTETPAANPIGPDLRNGGFEATASDGSPNDWQTYGGDVKTTSSARTGSRAARFVSGTDSTKWLYQAVTVSGGVSYGFSAWLRIDRGVASALLRISWYASDDASGRAIATADSLTSLDSPSPEYEFLSTDGVVAPAEAHSARLRIVLAPQAGTTATIFADDASFGEEPSTEQVPPVAQDDAGPVSNIVLGTGATPSVPAARRAPQSAARGASKPRLVINEVMYNPTGDDAAEWVELYNSGDAVVSLAGWSLADAAGSDTLSDTKIPAHGFAVIAASDSSLLNSQVSSVRLLVLAGRIGNGLGNLGDRLELRDPAGDLVDAISWGADSSVLKPPIAGVPSGHSIERRLPGVDSDVAADWVDNMNPSPGAAYAPAPSVSSGQFAADATPLAAGAELPLKGLAWATAVISALALTVALAWRAVPAVSHRLHRES